jgi:hypothetical protein
MLATRVATREVILAVDNAKYFDEDLVSIYRGTNNGNEINVFNESGAVLSDAGREAYNAAIYSGSNVDEALTIGIASF